MLYAFQYNTSFYAGLWEEFFGKWMLLINDRLSHTPHVPGEILNEQMCMKDHTGAKNPKPAERRR